MSVVKSITFLTTRSSISTPSSLTFWTWLTRYSLYVFTAGKTINSNWKNSETCGIANQSFWQWNSFDVSGRNNFSSNGRHMFDMFMTTYKLIRKSINYNDLNYWWKYAIDIFFHAKDPFKASFMCIFMLSQSCLLSLAVLSILWWVAVLSMLWCVDIISIVKNCDCKTCRRWIFLLICRVPSWAL